MGIKVPDGGLEAAFRATLGYNQHNTKIALEAFLQWQKENPPVPTDEQLKQFRSAWVSEWGKTQEGKGDFFVWALTKWVSRMYDEPEPEVPEEIKDLLKEGAMDLSAHWHYLTIIEAFRRGQKAGPK